MKRIKQEHNTGCGIACVAMLSEMTYSKAMQKARKKFSWESTKRSFYTDSSQLKELLDELKVNTDRYRLVRNWSSLPDTAIIAINYREKSNNWHWVVFKRENDIEYVLDPLSKRDLRKDFSRMRLHGCIPVNI
ncbi:MAG: cysteine peptidase family C39 domain-containing protein [Pseudomonadota bacterium]